MMQLSGFELSAPIVNGVTAYVPALLVASIVLHYLLKKHFGFFRNVFGILAPIFIYSHILNTYGNLSQWMEYESYFTVGILRGIAGMTVGAECYIVINWIKNWNRYIRLFVGVVSVYTIGALIFAQDIISYSDEGIYPYVFATFLGVVYSRQENKSWIFENIFCYLGKISYGIFLVHYGVCKLLGYYLPGESYILMMLICIGISISLGAVLTKLSYIIIQKCKG